MPPARPRGTPADEASHGKERASGSSYAHSNTKSARNGHQGTGTVTSSLREVTTTNDASTNHSGSGTNGSDPNGGIAWQTLPTPVLHAYRHAYRLPTPSAFSSGFNQMVLSNPGIGRHSPTMAKRLEKRRVSKEQLAMAVRKNFNGAGIQEGDVVVDFLYKVRWQDKNFRMRFTPGRNR